MGKEYLEVIYDEVKGFDARGLEGLNQELKNLRNPFLQTVPARAGAVPSLIFLEPITGAKPINPPFEPENYGLENYAYKALTNGKGGLILPAKGEVHGKYFVVEDVPSEALSAIDSIETEPVCGLVHIAGPNYTQQSVSRTGTLLKYEAKGDKMRVKPVTKGKKSLSGKGIFLGAWPKKDKLGGMDEKEYEWEIHCPHTVGGATFEYKGKTYYTAYRLLEANSRLDQPYAYLLLQQEGEANALPKKLAKSLNTSYGICSGAYVPWNVTIEGEKVDFAEENPSGNIDYDIRKHPKEIEKMNDTIFSVLYRCAAAECGETELADLLRGKIFFSSNGRQELDKISRRYTGVYSEFIKAIKPENREYFEPLSDVGKYLEKFESRYKTQNS